MVDVVINVDLNIGMFYGPTPPRYLHPYTTNDKIIDTVVSTVNLLVLKLGFKKYIFEITEAKSIMLCDAVSLVCWRTSQTALVHVQQAGAEIAEWSKLINLENKYKI